MLPQALWKSNLRVPAAVSRLPLFCDTPAIHDVDFDIPGAIAITIEDVYFVDSLLQSSQLSTL
jgi:hypothetical protein